MSKNKFYSFLELAAFSSLLFITLLNINVIRIYKDTLSIVGVGVAKIGIVKGMLELPFSILTMYVCAFLHNKVGRLACFLITTTFFTIFFSIFGFLIYPHQQQITAFMSGYNAMTQAAVLQFPYIMLYIFGEVWVVVLYGFLVWSFIQSKSSKESVKKNYPVYTLIGQLSIICSGFILLKAKHKISTMIGTNCEVKTLATLIVITSTILVLIYLANFFYFPNVEQGKRPLVRSEGGNYITNTIKFLRQESNIKRMFITVLSYGFLATLMHLIWFHYITTHYQNDTSRLINLQSYLNYYIGSSTIALGLASKFILKRFSWKKIFISVPILGAALAIPFTMLVAINNFKSHIFGISIVSLTISVGNVYYVVSRALKYIIFDTSKEIFFSWYRDNEAKLFQGKSLIDVLAFKMGKSSGAFCSTLVLIFIQQQFLLGVSSILLVSATLLAYCIWIKQIKVIEEKQ